MRICFMGTPEFAVPSLKRIIDDGHIITGVFTQPDKPKGRGYTMSTSPVKDLAFIHQIPVFQPISLKDDDVFSLLHEMNPDLIVVAAYGKILPKEILNLPKFGCINVHASLLPKYRGAAPVQWSILNGEKQTGVTTMLMNEGLDTGDMILKSVIDIEYEDTTLTLMEKLSLCGADLLSETIKLIEEYKMTPIPQDDSRAIYAPMINKSLSKIDFNKDAKSIHNQIKGLNPWPIASFKINNKNIKVFSSRIHLNEDNLKFSPGEILFDNTFIIGCANNAIIEFLEVQAEGKKRMSAADFLRGYKISKGTIIE